MRTTIGTAAILLAVAASASAAPPKTLDIVTFTPPAGWKLEESPGHVQLTYTESTSFCLIGIYKSTDAKPPDLAANFASEWKHIVAQTLEPVPQPTPKPVKVGGTDALWGGAPSKKGDRDFYAQLFVIDAGAKVTSILILTYTADDFDAYRRAVEPMLAGMKITRTERQGAPPPPAAPPPVPKLQVPPPPKKLTLADIAGEWKMDDSVVTEYAKARTRTAADFDALPARGKLIIGAKGDTTVETAAKEGAAPKTSTAKATLSADKVLTLKSKGKGVAAQFYVVRGLLGEPTLTVMKMNGPWMGDVPMDVKADPTKGPTLDHLWVRAPKP
jgi:hypothetical protein